MVALNKEAFPVQENVDNYQPTLFYWRFVYFKSFSINPKKQRGNFINIVNEFERTLRRSSWMNESVEAEVYQMYKDFSSNKRTLEISRELFQRAHQAKIIGDKEFEKMKFLSDNLETIDIYQKATYAYVSFCLYISFYHGIKPFRYFSY